MEKGLVAVDRWEDGSQAYFLTHLHADHTAGLSRRWARGPLFCSPVSARLLPTKFPGFDLSLLHVLETGQPRSLSLVSLSTGSVVSVRVTAVDALHCPGAVMYLFQGEFGCVLYTGDFRWEMAAKKAWLAKMALLAALGMDSVNVLYLDNTFCHPSFAFPPRAITAQQVVDIIAAHPHHDIVIGIDTLGKEELLLHISHALNTKIWVWPERLQTMHLLGFDDVFTTKTSLTRLRAIPRYSLTVDTLKALNSIRPTIGIMPSGLPWAVQSCEEYDASLDLSIFRCLNSEGNGMNISTKGNGNQLSSSQRDHQYIYSVPYSDHSCFSEIGEFIKLIRPMKMTGIVPSSFCYINPQHYFGHFCGANQLSDQPSKSFRRNGIAERVEVFQTESVLLCEPPNKMKAKKGRTGKVAWLGVRRSRVSLLRREHRGAKIAEIDQISELNVQKT